MHKITMYFAEDSVVCCYVCGFDVQVFVPEIERGYIKESSIMQSIRQLGKRKMKLSIASNGSPRPTRLNNKIRRSSVVLDTAEHKIP